MAKAAESSQEHRFCRLGDAHKHAKHYARYVHRTFIVWMDKEGRGVAAPASVEHLETMLAEMDDSERPCTYYGADCMIISREIGGIMLANYRVGVPC